MSNLSNKEYVFFYESLKSFLIEIDASDRYDFGRATEAEIQSFEKEVGFPLPLAFKEYLRIFGNGLNLKGENNMNYSMVNLLNTTKLAKLNGTYEQISKARPELGHLLFLYYIDYNGAYGLIHETQSENPNYFVFYENEEVELINGFSFTTHLRSRIYELIFFTFFKHTYSLDEWRLKNKWDINMNNISWCQVYQEYIRLGNKGISEINWLRSEYYKIHEETEKSEKRVYSIDEFEWTFIEYCKNSGHQLPEFKNPYKKA